MIDFSPELLWGPTTYVLRVSLDDVEPEIWRRVRVSSELDLADLHKSLGRAMGWQGYHMHEFEVAGIRFGDNEDDEQVIDQGGIAVCQILPAVGSTMQWSYDFSDGWTHQVVVEAIEANDAIDAFVVDGARACPPEDSGGPWGYLDKLRALADPSDDEHDSTVEWMPEGFNSDAFDPTEANRRIRIS